MKVTSLLENVSINLLRRANAKNPDDAWYPGGCPCHPRIVAKAPTEEEPGSALCTEVGVKSTGQELAGVLHRSYAPPLARQVLLTRGVWWAVLPLLRVKRPPGKSL